MKITHIKMKCIIYRKPYRNLSVKTQKKYYMYKRIAELSEK